MEAGELLDRAVVYQPRRVYPRRRTRAERADRAALLAGPLAALSAAGSVLLEAPLSPSKPRPAAGLSRAVRFRVGSRPGRPRPIREGAGSRAGSFTCASSSARGHPPFRPHATCPHSLHRRPGLCSGGPLGSAVMAGAGALVAGGGVAAVELAQAPGAGRDSSVEQCSSVVEHWSLFRPTQPAIEDLRARRRCAIKVACAGPLHPRQPRSSPACISVLRSGPRHATKQRSERRRSRGAGPVGSGSSGSPAAKRACAARPGGGEPGLSGALRRRGGPS